MKAGWNSNRRRGTHVTQLRFFLLPRAAEITHGTAGERRRRDRLLTTVGDGDERDPRVGGGLASTSTASSGWSSQFLLGELLLVLNNFLPLVEAPKSLKNSVYFCKM